MQPKTQTHPPDPIAAVTHSDPYPYYAGLVARQPIYYDEVLKFWIASSAAAMTAVLTSDLCQVRPPTERVPRALLGSSAANIFQRLVRMNDGESHWTMKQAVSATLGSIKATQVGEQSYKWARWLSDEIRPEADSSRLSDFAFQLPVYVVASLLGVPQDMLPQTAGWMSDFVRCLAPTSSPQQIEQGKTAADYLLDMFHSLAAQVEPADGFLTTLAREAKRVGQEDTDVMVANGIGFLSQAYEATAGLIGNTLVALAAHRQAREQVTADLSLLRQVIQEVLRYDSPIQNTRRFIARNGILAGREMKAGDAVLVVLAAANRDPTANPTPERFDMFRKDRQIFTFGVGAHACPGEMLATTIAKSGIEQLLMSGIDPERLVEKATYRASANTRIPLWATEGDR